MWCIHPGLCSDAVSLSLSLPTLTSVCGSRVRQDTFKQEQKHTVFPTEAHRWVRHKVRSELKRCTDSWTDPPNEKVRRIHEIVPVSRLRRWLSPPQELFISYLFIYLLIFSQASRISPCEHTDGKNVQPLRTKNKFKKTTWAGASWEMSKCWSSCLEISKLCKTCRLSQKCPKANFPGVCLQ